MRRQPGFHAAKVGTVNKLCDLQKAPSESVAGPRDLHVTHTAQYPVHRQRFSSTLGGVIVI